MTSSGAADARPRLPAAFPRLRMWSPFVAGAICLYLHDRNNVPTVHLRPQKCNACYARLRQLGASVESQSLDGECAHIGGTSVSGVVLLRDLEHISFFRPVGTPEVLAPQGKTLLRSIESRAARG